MIPPNFVTECFFLLHILLSFQAKKLETFYMKNNEELNKAIGEKNYQLFDEILAKKLCMDAHVFGKNTLSLYRSLFSLTNVLIICVGERTIPTDKMFESCHAFLSKGVNPNNTQLNNRKLSADFLSLPQLIFQNLNSFPKLFKMINPESYVGSE